MKRAPFDVCPGNPESQRTPRDEQSLVAAVIGPLEHEMQNRLQNVRMELDLLTVCPDKSLEPEKIIATLDGISRSLRDLRDYLLPPEPQFTSARIDLILGTLLQHKKEELDRHSIRVDVVRQGPMPMVRVDPEQLRHALEHVIASAVSLAEKPGAIEIRIGPRKIDERRYVELVLATSFSSAPELDEKDVFQTFFRLKNQQIGLDMVLARRILEHQQAHISLRMPSSQRIEIVILLKVSAN